MSYEGYEQNICKNGHHWNSPAEYVFSEASLARIITMSSTTDEPKCPHCREPVVWRNSVDDTNCDSYGYIDMAQFEIRPAKIETCNLGHQHVIEAAVYRIPTPEEKKAARTFRDHRGRIQKCDMTKEELDRFLRGK